MSKNAKVKGENVKELTFDVKNLNLDDRCEFNNIVTKQPVDKMVWGDYVKMIRIATNLTDDDINDFTDTEVITIAWKCYEVVNKKKLKK
tara:strand:- start:185 stop:451 length:267 start_codon:yes stop_codon:yes gene_type:complete